MYPGRNGGVTMSGGTSHAALLHVRVAGHSAGNEPLAVPSLHLHSVEEARFRDDTKQAAR